MRTSTVLSLPPMLVFLDLPYHPMVKGLSPTTAGGTRREKMVKQVSI
jgi:hypothetical protein